MAEYIPIFVKDDAELEQAIQLKRTVIVVTNKSIYDSIQQQAAKGKKKRKQGLIGGTVSAAVLAFMTGPIALAALFTLGGSSLKGLSGLVDDQFKDYQVFVDEKTEQLLLVRAKGDNSFQEGDTIRGYNIKLQ